MEDQMVSEYITATSVEDVINILSEQGSKARIIAGATDLMIEIDQGMRLNVEKLIDISRINGLNKIQLVDGIIHLGPMVTHNQCVASELILENAFPLAQAVWEVGSPQIRNRGTIAGNLITGSPANDTITPLMALGAQVTLRSKLDERIVPLKEFYTGVRKTVIKPEEMVVNISFPALDKKSTRGGFLKIGLRAAHSIAIVNSACILSINMGVISAASITLGAVAPVIIHVEEAEKYLVGKSLDGETIDKVADLAMQASKPIDDIRGSAEYRKQMVGVLVSRLLEQIRENTEQDCYPTNPILLWGKKQIDASMHGESISHGIDGVIKTCVNGKQYSVRYRGQKSLLQLLRDDLLLIGTKEGCAEGECGACTVILDGVAVMSCLVPAARAHGAEILTIEGLATDDQLHPIQQAFVENGAAQCGYCTPGMIMSAVQLVEERSDPTQYDIKRAISGNLCRCTGYHKIIQAIENAGRSISK